MAARTYTVVDKLILGADRALRTVIGRAPATARADPAAGVPLPRLSRVERDLSSRLMRVNHAGEVSAQALYQGQACTARNASVRRTLETAAAEENDHLLWCARRLRSLDARPSRLNPLWYAGSFVIGALAGAAGDRWNLGFLAETERRVVHHLDGHLARLPQADAPSRAVLEQMRSDEARHATTATHAGAARLPAPVRALMTAASRVMTGVAYWV